MKIDELIRDHEISAADLFTEASAGCCSDDKVAAKLFHRMDISPVVDLGWRNGMLTAMSRQDINLVTAIFTIKERGAWIPVGG